MTLATLLKVIGWVVVIWAIIGAAGTYRYFITPVELRFTTTEALWLAGSFVGDLLLAVGLLVLIRERRVDTPDE